MPARKKDPSARARRNKTATRATLQRRSDLRSVDEFEDLTVAQLRAAIDQVNATRPIDQQVSKRGVKADLVDRLAAANSPVPRMPTHPPQRLSDGEVVPADWHPQTVAWWNDVWTSPMASEWDDSDVHNVMVMALLYDDIWAATDPKARKEALAELRQQRGELGLTPYSRRRLEWTIETAAEAKDRGDRRRQMRGDEQPKKAKGKKPDPRAYLTSVS